ncbi:SacI homology domain-containing protein [Parasitella parasitica]|nr:SacI homology domain-containing protein [Parasitella parasitica]
MIYEQLELRITNEAYHFTPLIEPAKEGPVLDYIETLTIYRNSGEPQLNAPPIQNAVVESELMVYGILGFIQLQAGEYMLVITGCQRLGTLVQGCDVLRATTFQILPIARNTNILSSQQLDDEQKYVQLIENHLRFNGFYFSYNYNITLSIQKQAYLANRGRDNSWSDADPRFFWNRYLSEKLISATTNSRIRQDFSRFILPVIQGFVSINPSVINNRAITFALISRRSQERAGTRYFSRGLDEYGYASNFVETEQLLFCDPSKSLVQNNLIRTSFIQTRGSVPALWGQIPNTRYTPKLWVNANLADEKVIGASKAHFTQQIKHYGPQILVNLTNTKGYEYPVGHLFAGIVRELSNPNIKYIHFDFHHECRKMKWHRVQLLVDQLEPDLRKQGYCVYDASNESEPVLRKEQTSVVRTNCMDCLDRTNVVQSTLGKWVLNRQLREIGILQSTEVIENDEQFMQVFKNVWADNADGLSIPYSGTGALKTDFTRTGRRTRIGMINDFNNSAIRYIKNNYLDGSRQDGIDLILGKYRVPLSHAQSPFRESTTSIAIKLIPLYLLIALTLFLMVLFDPTLFSIRSSTVHITALSFTFAVTLTCWLFIQQNGAEFVDWPRLLPDQVPHTASQEKGHVMNSNTGQLDAVQSKASDLLYKWTHRRDSTAVLNEAEQGYELIPPLKKNT